MVIKIGCYKSGILIWIRKYGIYLLFSEIDQMKSYLLVNNEKYSFQEIGAGCG
jgi:hypothetical protein